MIALMFAIAGFLINEWDDDDWRYCEYDDGRVVMISLNSMCAMRIPSDD